MLHQLNSVSRRLLALLLSVIMLLARPLAARGEYEGEIDFDDDPAEVTRLAGHDRLETAALISADAFQKADTVVLVSGRDYPDALAGVSLAYALEAPILLVTNTVTEKSVAYQEVVRLGAKKILVLGGDTAVAPAKIAIFSEEKGFTVDRIAGKNRFDTALQIADALKKLKGEPETVFFASSAGFADALSVSTVAALCSSPVLYLAPSGKIDAATNAFLKSIACKNAVIVGGTAAVGSAAETALKDCGFRVERRSGNDRFGTNLDILTHYEDLFPLRESTVSVASGLDFPDALTGADWAAKNHAPLLLVGKKISADQQNWYDLRLPQRLIVFGGEAAVSRSVVNTLSPGSEPLSSPGN